jgi:anthranilate synthase component 2
MKILLLDNYDSFTYNLLQLLHEAGAPDTVVIRNDAISPEDAAGFDAVVISPGPGIPEEAGITIELIRRYGPMKKMLGVCLGMQAMAVAFGGSLWQPGEILHGERVRIVPAIPADPLFTGMEQGFEAGLYHSWAVDAARLPAALIPTSADSRGIIMSLRHNSFNMCGVQFHPESIMTPMGLCMIRNWLGES